jgi:ATP-dependent helicase/nuclease subunit B
MQRDVEIWTGIANTGKTRELLAVYRGALKSNAESGEFGRTLWLTPTNESRRQLLGQLTDEETSVCFSPNVMTFPAFAEAVLRSAGEPVEEISPVIKQRLIRTVIDELKNAGQLPYFSPIAATTGYPQLVMSFIAELKREEIWPEQFAEVSAAENQSDKDRELALIYTTYQNRLLNAKLYDGEGRFWAARDVAARSGLGPFANLSLVVVDGFSDFTHTQYELLAHLSRSAERMRISLPLETPQTREDVFAKPQAAYKKLTAFLQLDEAVADRIFSVGKQERPNEAPPAISHLADQLFANPHQARQSSDSTGLNIVAVTGPIREIDFLAERVKRLLFSGVAAEDIVITFRTLNDDNIHLVRERFLAAEIPFSLQTGLPLLRAPLLRTLFDVLWLELEDWPFERLMSVLRSNLFRPEWDIPDMEIAAASSTVAKLLCERKLHSQRHIILQVLTREAKRSADLVEAESLSETQRSSKKDNARNLGGALSLLEQLSTATRKLQGERDFAQWVQRLTELARELGIAPSATKSKATNLSPEDAKQFHDDSRTWDHFERLLFDAAKADAFEPDTIRKLNLTEFLNAVVELLESQYLPTAGTVPGCVRILEASSVRNLDIRYLFLAGLTESNFPGSRSDDCFYSE